MQPEDQRGSEIKVREGAALWRDLDGESVLLSVDDSRYLGLNSAGTILWPMLIKGTTRHALVERLVEAFGVDGDRAAADVDTFLAGCLDRGLLELPRQ